jgi:hypothetical protein
MEHQNDSIRVTNPSEYPYEVQAHLTPDYPDPFHRNPHKLIASLAHFGQLMQSTGRTTGFSSLIPLLPTITRFFEGTCIPADLHSLLSEFPYPPVESRHCYSPGILDQPLSHIASSLDNLRYFEEVLIPHALDRKSWVVFLVKTANPSVECYYIGSINPEELSYAKRKLQTSLEQMFPTQTFQFWRRYVPQLYPAASDKVGFVYVLMYYLHQHANYLDINNDTLVEQKLSLLTPTRNRRKQLLRWHDEWLGRLRPKYLDTHWHPFVAKVVGDKQDVEDETDCDNKHDTEEKRKERKDLEQLLKLGWAIIDVEGDGNCGYYCLILGLEAHGIMSFSARTRNARWQHMQVNIPWQFCVLQFREKLQKESKSMVKNVFGKDIMNFDWFYTTTASNWEEFTELSQWFLSPKFRQVDYFSGKLISHTLYQMNPYWTSLVFSYAFKIRVVIYQRQTTYTAGDATEHFKWSTHTVNYNTEPKDHIVNEQGLNRLSDNEFKRIPTIELLYTNGYLKDGSPDHQHIQFLRRVYCDNASDWIPDTTPIDDIVDENVQIQTTYDVLGLYSDSQATDSDHSVSNDSQTVVADTLTLDNAQKSDSQSTDSNHSVSNDAQAVVAETLAQDKDNVAQNMSEEALSSDDDVRKKAQPTKTTEKKRKSSQKKRNSAPKAGKLPPKKKLKTSIDKPNKRDTIMETIINLRDTRPANAKMDESLSITKKKQIKKNMKQFFNEMLYNGTSKHNTAAQMFFNSSERTFYVRLKDANGRNGPASRCDNLEMYDDNLILSAKECPDEWMGVTVGDSGSFEVPDHLRSLVPTIYQQFNQRHCLAKSFASALFYCGFRYAAEYLAEQAPVFSTMQLKAAIKSLRGLMLNLLPVIAIPSVYNVRPNTHSRKLTKISWNEVIEKPTPFPTLIIPVLPNGSTSHAFTVVDDLIFDSSTQFAMRLGMESIRYIFDSDCGIYCAYRFEGKFAPKGQKCKDTYERQVKLHWPSTT